MTDDEIANRLVKMISNLKKSKATFRLIVGKTQIKPSQEEGFTVISKKELAELKEIKQRFNDIRTIAINMHKFLKEGK